MTEANTDHIELRGNRVLLRDTRPSDIDARLRWVTVETEWGEWDAPWEGNEPLPPEKVPQVRSRALERIAEPLPVPRTLLYIQKIDGPLIGWVGRYDYNPEERSVWIGIDICESAFWGQGLGTEALNLWINYLFENLELDHIRFSTWSGNERMIRCGEKCGFVLEERIPNAREVGGRTYDAVKFGLRCRTEGLKTQNSEPRAKSEEHREQTILMAKQARRPMARRIPDRKRQDRSDGVRRYRRGETRPQP